MKRCMVARALLPVRELRPMVPVALLLCQDVVLLQLLHSKRKHASLHEDVLLPRTLAFLKSLRELLHRPTGNDFHWPVEAELAIVQEDAVLYGGVVVVLPQDVVQSLREKHSVGINLHKPIMPSPLAVLDDLSPNLLEDACVADRLVLATDGGMQVRVNNTGAVAVAEGNLLGAVDCKTIASEDREALLALHLQHLRLIGPGDH
mmetsp:Transcript_32341/g.68908  ORF Transcript_32341/g.68908 Transcript_32341/m.68908 type:complete len:204 (+) Transcript_32341:158-769(+)